MVTFDDPGAWENPSNPWRWVWVLDGYAMADPDPYPCYPYPATHAGL